MSKTLETKKKILNLLKKREMTVTELSRQLDLTTATVSQHMDELQSAGAVKKIDNEHYKKLKYYKVSPMADNMFAKYVVGAIILIAIVGIFIAYGIRQPSTPATTPGIVTNVHTTTTTNSTQSNATNTTNATAPALPGTGAFACPMITYEMNGSIYEYSNATMYTLNSSSGSVSDYVVAPGSKVQLYAREHVINALPEPANTSSGTPALDQNRSHYVVISNVHTGIPMSGEGINITISPQTYNVTQGETLDSTISLAVAQNASNATYWLRMDGPCGGGVAPILITIGAGPYTGNVTRTGGIYE
jgi:DNA-binding transcriptional ArsR family regulator